PGRLFAILRAQGARSSTAYRRTRAPGSHSRFVAWLPGRNFPSGSIAYRRIRFGTTRTRIILDKAAKASAAEKFACQRNQWALPAFATVTRGCVWGTLVLDDIAKLAPAEKAGNVIPLRSSAEVAPEFDYRDFFEGLGI